MKRMIFAAIVLLIIGACLPTNLMPTTAPQPTIDVGGLTQTDLQLIPSATATIQPTPTPPPATETASPVPSVTETETATTSPVLNLTTTPATATEFTISPVASTATLAVAGTAAATTTPHKITYGTLPPEVPFSQITLINRSKVEAYISLQVTTVEDRATIIEYPVHGRIKLKAPLGSYLYVAWVGGRQMIGSFYLNKDEELVITLYKDRVVIK